MSEKPVYPFSQGQIFENLSYRTPYGVDTERKNFVKEVLQLRNSKYFFIEDSVENLTFSDRPYVDYNARKKRFRPSVCGYPINQKVSNKLFQLTKPYGHWFPSFDQKIFELLGTVPLIAFRVLKNVKSLSGTGQLLPRGNYFSIGKVEEESNHIPNTAHNPRPFFEVVEVDGDMSKMFQVYDSRWTCDRFSLLNVFVPARVFAEFDQIGLVLLPNGSVTWLWHDGKWKTCKVSTTTSKTGSSFCTKFTEVDMTTNGILQDKNCLLEINGKEIDVHKKIVKLFEQDDLRLAFRSFTKIESNPTISHPRSQLVSMIAKNFKSEFLDPYKMNLLKATDYKNMSSFGEFALALAQKSRPLSASLNSKSHLDWLTEFAVAAARDGTPLFWGIDAMLSNRSSGFLKQALKSAGFSQHSSGHVTQIYALYHFGVNSNDIKDNLLKRIKVNFSATVEKPVWKTYKVAPKDGQEVIVPDFVLRKGDKAVKEYVASHFLDNITEYQLRNYQTATEPTYRDRMGEIKIKVDTSSITINETIHS